MNSTVASAAPAAQHLALVLTCEGMGDCLFAQAVMKRLQREHQGRYVFHLFTHRPELFAKCPYVASVHHVDDRALGNYPNRVRMFETEKLEHWRVDTFDFMSIPLGLGTLTFAEKEIEYFPAEPDQAQAFDVVLNTSMTWPTRSWPLESWQRLANALAARGLRVAVVGKDVHSRRDNLDKLSPPLEGVANLANMLSLDQTYHTIARCGLFVSGQGGLTVLAGATEAEIIVLGMSIEWSRRAIYRHGNPHYKVTYVTGTCPVHCGTAADCPLPENQGELKCVPGYAAVERAVLAKLSA
jgi:ADP-heptose:LPS heptosyltransferase